MEKQESKIEYVPIDDLKTDGQNPNEMKADKFQALVKSITKYGFAFPVITNKDLIIADGEHRWKAGKQLGFKEVPVLRLPMKEVDRRLARQVFNKIKGEHEFYKDMEDYRLIIEQGNIELLKDHLAMTEKELKDIQNVLDNNEDLDLSTVRGS